MECRTRAYLPAVVRYQTRSDAHHARNGIRSHVSSFAAPASNGGDDVVGVYLVGHPNDDYGGLETSDVNGCLPNCSFHIRGTRR